MKAHFSHFFVILAFILVGLFLVHTLNLSIPVSVTTSTISSELSVVGEGKVDVVPDTAYVDVGLFVENIQTADLAQKQITEKNNELIKAMKELGVADSDMKTSNFSVNPNYVYDGGRNRATGYNGNVTLTVKTKDTSLAARIMETATKVGANQIQGTRFTVDEPEKYREEARDKAIANAKEQAEKLASSLGISLGQITNIVESSPGMVSPYMYADKAMAQGMGGGNAASPELQPGQQTITSTVTLYFEKR